MVKSKYVMPEHRPSTYCKTVSGEVTPGTDSMVCLGCRELLWIQWSSLCWMAGEMAKEQRIWRRLKCKLEMAKGFSLGMEEMQWRRDIENRILEL